MWYFGFVQEKHWTPRVTVKENLMPHVADSETPLVNYMGQYDKDRLKYRLQRNQELRDFAEKVPYAWYY